MSRGFLQRLCRGVYQVRQRPDWAGFVQPGWDERIMKVVVTDRLHSKQGRSVGRWILHSDQGRLSVYLKRHYRLPWWRGLLATLWPGGGWSPAIQEWRHLEWARAQGLPVPSAVAAGEHIGPWGRLQSFLAVEELRDMLPLHEAIPAAAQLPPAVFERWKRSLTAEIARLTRALHARRYFHRDLYLCHFYVRRQDTQCLPSWRGRVHLIDFHRLTYHNFAWRFWQIKDLGQLLFSSDLPEISVRDRWRFWRAYLGEGRHSLVAKILRQGILFKWRRYRRHNIKRAAA